MNRTLAAIERAARDVRGSLGPGLSERAYHTALETELSYQGMPFSSESTIPIYYRQKPIAYRQPDLVIGEKSKILVELKSSSNRGLSQLQSYLKLAEDDENLDITAGLLIQFNNDGIQTTTERY